MHILAHKNVKAHIYFHSDKNEKWGGISIFLYTKVGKHFIDLDATSDWEERHLRRQFIWVLLSYYETKWVDVHLY